MGWKRGLVMRGPIEAPAGRGALSALLRGLCPRCREGRVFAGSIVMNAACPRCGRIFEREPGYFVAAMYISYGMTLALILILFGLVWLAAPRLPLWGSLSIALLLFAFFVPAVFRCSRLLWMYIDHAIDPS
jgi:uncharacterized protein (DUF983 family)